MNLNDLKNLFGLHEKSFVPNVGIGTDSPAANLEVREDHNGMALMMVTNRDTGNAARAGYAVGTVGQDNGTMWGGGANLTSLNYRNKFTVEAVSGLNLEAGTDHMRFATASNLDGGGERMRITYEGRVGMGTDNPTTGTMLDVYGTGALFSSIRVPRGPTGGRPSIANGMVRYNTDNNKLEVAENGSWVTYTVSSDGRLKKDVMSVPNGLAMAEKMRPVFFNWDYSNPKAQGYEDKRQVGFIAQELEEVLPEVVRSGEDTYRTVQYGQIVAIAIAAIQELNERQKNSDQMCLNTQREIQSLRDENQQLRDTVRALDERLRKLENK